MTPAARPLLTVAICTHNRAPYLDKALASLLRQTADAASFEILVVDNASTDDTRSVVERSRALRPDIRYVHEARLGLSHARNRAIAETGTPVIAFLDDDAIASHPWSSGSCTASPASILGRLPSAGRSIPSGRRRAHPGFPTACSATSQSSSVRAARPTSI